MSLQLARVCLLRRRFKTLFLLNLFIKLVFSFRASHRTNEWDVSTIYNWHSFICPPREILLFDRQNRLKMGRTRREFNSILQFINVELQMRWGKVSVHRSVRVFELYLACFVLYRVFLVVYFESKRYPFSDPTQTWIGSWAWLLFDTPRCCCCWSAKISTIDWIKVNRFGRCIWCLSIHRIFSR